MNRTNCTERCRYCRDLVAPGFSCCCPGEDLEVVAQALLDQWDGRTEPLNPVKLWDALRAALPPRDNS